MENAAGRKILFDNEEFAAPLLNATQEVTIIFLLAEEGRWLPDRFLAAATGVFSLI